MIKEFRKINNYEDATIFMLKIGSIALALIAIIGFGGLLI